MRTGTIIKIITFIIILFMLVFFVFENIDPVPIWIPLFKGRHIGLIYIIVAFYILGAVNALWMVTVIGNERKKKLKLQEIPEHEQSLFEDEA